MIIRTLCAVALVVVMIAFVVGTYAALDLMRMERRERRRP